MPSNSLIKGYFVAAACLLLTISNVSAQWKKVETGTLSWLYALEFVNERQGWAGGTNGNLLTTNDGGATWKRAEFPNRDTIRDIVFRGDKVGWLLCERTDQHSKTERNRSYLMKTEDGGSNWTSSEFTADIDRMVRLVIASSGEGFAVGEGGAIAALPNGRTDPAKIVLPVKFLILGGAWLDPSRIVLVGGGGTSIITDDRGLSWQSSRMSAEAAETRLSSVFFSNSLKGWSVGNAGTIQSTTNGGRSWIAAAKPTVENLLDVRFIDGRVGFAVGEKGTIVRSNDGGATWVRVASPTPHRLERLRFAGRKALAAGFGGTIVAADLDGP